MKISQEVIKNISDELESGLLCYLNIETLEVVAIPDEDQLFEMDIEDWDDLINQIEQSPDKFKLIEKMSSTESFSVMESFIETVEDGALQSRLTQAISGYKPFANFKLQIDQSGPYRNKWFSYRTDKITEWVTNQLEDIP